MKYTPDRASNRRWASRSNSMALLALLCLFTLPVSGLALAAVNGSAPAKLGPQSSVTVNKASASAAPVCGAATVMPMAPVGNGVTPGIGGVVAISPNDVWAVGQASLPVNPEGETFSQPVTMHWNGVAWTSTTQSWPGNFSTGYALNAVSAVTANDVWTVGYQRDFLFNVNKALAPADLYNAKTVAAHWDGNSWTKAQMPDLADGPGPVPQLYDVAAVASDNVWAVGNDLNSALIMNWNGLAWRKVAAPNIGSGPSILYSVAARFAGDIWAVGFYQDNGPVMPLLEHWDGLAWAQIKIPNARPGDSLRAVAAPFGDDIWVAGENIGLHQALVYHWDGHVWNLLSIEHQQANSVITDIAARGPHDAWLGGSYALADNPNRFLEHWDGVQWSQVASSGAVSLALLPSVLWFSTAGGMGRLSLVPFSDIAGDTFASYIQDLYCRGIVDGLSDNTFGPNQPTTRATLARWIVKARGWPLANPARPTFIDVPATQSDYHYIETAAQYGVISGYDTPVGREYRPDNNLTRGQMSKMVVIALGWTSNVSGGPHFHDVATNNPFYEQIETMFNRGVVSGYADGSFRWNLKLTRGQLSKALYNALIQ